MKWRHQNFSKEEVFVGQRYRKMEDRQGAKPPADGRFFVIFGKKNYFNAIESHFASVQSHLKALDFWHLKANWKNQII